MARPYSFDLRKRVVAAVLAGESCRRVAGLFKVSVSSVVKWSQHFRATGSVAAKPMGRRQPRSLAGEREWLLARLASVPDLTLRGLVGELRERGVATSYGSVWRIVHDADRMNTFHTLKFCENKSRGLPVSGIPVTGLGRDRRQVKRAAGGGVGKADLLALDYASLPGARDNESGRGQRSEAGRTGQSEPAFEFGEQHLQAGDGLHQRSVSSPQRHALRRCFGESL